MDIIGVGPGERRSVTRVGRGKIVMYRSRGERETVDSIKVK
jgi:hypothetical protein